VHAGEHVVLAVDLARADLVEECHHDERVEDDREMLVRWRPVVHVATTVDVQQALACSPVSKQVNNTYYRKVER